MAHANAQCFSPRKRNLHQHGQIEVIFGPMFSGKTTELLRRIKRYQVAKYRCLLVKYAKDTRYDENGVATHDSQVAVAVACTQLDTIEQKAQDCDVIGIDEGQFFPDVVEFSERMANQGKTVLVAALDGDFQRKGFGSILELVPLAENIVKLSAVCMICYEQGAFTKRLGLETEIEVIGGAEKYMAACRKCHFKNSEDIRRENTKQENNETQKENIVEEPSTPKKENIKQTNNTSKKVLGQKRKPFEPLINVEYDKHLKLAAVC